MPTLAQDYAASTNSDFVQRITIAIVAAAQAISTEATNTVNHANRVALMRQVANNPLNMAYSFAVILASQGLDDTSTDAAINSMVSAVWNTVAGVP